MAVSPERQRAMEQAMAVDALHQSEREFSRNEAMKVDAAAQQDDEETGGGWQWWTQQLGVVAGDVQQSASNTWNETCWPALQQTGQRLQQGWTSCSQSTVQFCGQQSQRLQQASGSAGRAVGSWTQQSATQLGSWGGQAWNQGVAATSRSWTLVQQQSARAATGIADTTQLGSTRCCRALEHAAQVTSTHCGLAVGQIGASPYHVVDVLEPEDDEWVLVSPTVDETPPAELPVTIVKGGETDGSITCIPALVVQLLSVLAFCAAAVSLFTVSAQAVTISSITVLLLSTLLFFDYRQPTSTESVSLSLLGDLRQEQEDCLTTLKAKARENQDLTQQISEAPKSAASAEDRLDKVERTLMSIAGSGSKQKKKVSVDRLVELVHEYDLVQTSLQQSTQAECLDEVINAVLQLVQESGDLDDSKGIEEALQQAQIPVRALVKRLIQQHQSRTGTDFNMATVMKLDQGAPLTLNHIVVLCRNVVDENVPESEKMFRVVSA